MDCANAKGRGTQHHSIEIFPFASHRLLMYEGMVTSLTFPFVALKSRVALYVYMSVVYKDTKFIGRQFN
jgi:hypothetical protein